MAKIASVASTALKLGKFAASVLNVEEKFLDTTHIENTNLTYNGVVTWLTDINQGVGSSERNGQSVLCKSLHYRNNLQSLLPATYPSLNSATLGVRVMLIIDTQPDQALPVITDIIAGAGGTYASFGFLQMNSAGRFTVLMDKTYTLSYQNPGAYIEESFNFKNHHLRWDLTGDTQADVMAGHIYEVLITNNSGTTIAQSTSFSRIRFIDN